MSFYPLRSLAFRSFFSVAQRFHILYNSNIDIFLLLQSRLPCHSWRPRKNTRGAINSNNSCVCVFRRNFFFCNALMFASTVDRNVSSRRQVHPSPAYVFGWLNGKVSVFSWDCLYARLYDTIYICDRLGIRVHPDARTPRTRYRIYMRWV